MGQVSMPDTSAVVIVVPVLSRPANVAPLMASVAEATRPPFRLLFVASEGDDEEHAALEAAGADWMTVGPPGRYGQKCNAGARGSTEPLIFTAADDLRFHPGWLEAAIAHLGDGAEVVGTNDLGNPRVIAGQHSTHTLWTRRYIEQVGGVIDEPPGVIYHEGYPHDYVDDEGIGTARARGVYAHAHDSHVEHMHWLFGKGEQDDVYRFAMDQAMQGRRLYARRRRLWARAQQVRL